MAWNRCGVELKGYDESVLDVKSRKTALTCESEARGL